MSQILDIKPPQINFDEKCCNICFEISDDLIVPCCLAICVACSEKEFRRQNAMKKFVCPFDGVLLKSHDFNTNYCLNCSAPITHFMDRDIACSNKNCTLFQCLDCFMPTHGGQSCKDATEKRYSDLKGNLKESKGAYDKTITANFLPSCRHMCISCDTILSGKTNHLTCNQCKVTFCILCRMTFTADHLNPVNKHGC